MRCLMLDESFAVTASGNIFPDAVIDASSLKTGSLKTGKIAVSNMKATKIIFNAPATIVIWDDNTKTVVKCGDRDVYDPEKGLALCFMKKMLGNTGRYYETVKKALAEYEKENNNEEAGAEV